MQGPARSWNRRAVTRGSALVLERQRQPMAVQVETAEERDLPKFAAMEQGIDTREFIVPHELQVHRERFGDPDIIYLRIVNGGELAGFFILVRDPDGHSIEFRRIVVASKGRGIGQEAIAEMEEYCRSRLRRTRIWLDVFEHNARGRHIYEKLHYRRFGRSDLDGEPLLLYEKQL